MENEKISQENYLAKNIKKIFLIFVVLVIVLIILAIINRRVDMLDKLSQIIMTKLMQ